VLPGQPNRRSFDQQHPVRIGVSWGYAALRRAVGVAVPDCREAALLAMFMPAVVVDSLPTQVANQ
jgi:hypothetical protein